MLSCTWDTRTSRLDIPGTLLLTVLTITAVQILIQLNSLIVPAQRQKYHASCVNNESPVDR